MPRWPGCDEANAVVTTLQFFNDLESGPGGKFRDGPRIHRGVGVLINIAATGVAEGTQLVEIVAVMDSNELRASGGVTWRDDEVTAEVQVLDGGHRGDQAFWSFRMPGFFVSRVAVGPINDEHHGLVRFGRVHVERDTLVIDWLDGEAHTDLSAGERRCNWEPRVSENGHHVTVLEQGLGGERRDATHARSIGQGLE